MKKKTLLLMILVCILMLTGCGSHKHEWAEADCVNARTCLTCGETEGSALGHTWIDATCTTAKTCSVCKEVSGEPFGHVFADATCTKPKTCKVCGDTEGQPLGHEWTEATCTTPKTCLTCKETEGDVTGHVLVGASCVDGGTCSVCGENVDAPGHTWIDATCINPKVCSVCGEEEGAPLGHTTANGACNRCGKEIHEPIVYSGSGDSVITGVNVPSGIYKITLKNSGRRNFIVKGYTAAGSRLSSWANEIGNYNGSVVLTEDINGGIIEVTSDGTWSISFEGIEDGCTSNITGSGDTVTPWFTLDSGALVVSLSNVGQRNFIVKVYDEYGNRYSSLANEIGTYSGQVVFNRGENGTRYCLEVISEGTWTVDFGLGADLTKLD